MGLPVSGNNYKPDNVSVPSSFQERTEYDE
jgi:hypothetical protein